ncbi:hypothetical protein Hamer_G018676 [Homarus americanus]|uniref:Uncharacterized protein n=1 Tax=Homarus americanus TaxID=6706 RepID=A0A8J5N4T8_HOMAM|nr:hypothetical protein Hamer_G018676 [Homarus americanus]
MSAFSRRVTVSPSACSAATRRSRSSSRQRFMRALLFLSSMGFMTRLYWSVRDTGSTCTEETIVLKSPPTRPSTAGKLIHKSKSEGGQGAHSYSPPPGEGA